MIDLKIELIDQNRSNQRQLVGEEEELDQYWFWRIANRHLKKKIKKQNHHKSADQGVFHSLMIEIGLTIY